MGYDFSDYCDICGVSPADLDDDDGDDFEDSDEQAWDAAWGPRPSYGETERAWRELLDQVCEAEEARRVFLASFDALPDDEAPF